MNSLCQLASTWGGVDPPPGAMAEEKRDGWRAIYLRGVDGLPRLFTRGGHPVPGAGHITHVLAAMERAAGEPMVFDGEFQVGGTLEATKRWCERDWKLGGEAGKLFAFDCLTQAEWDAGGSPIPVYERKQRLIELRSAAMAELEDEWTWREGSRGRDAYLRPVEVIPHYNVFTQREVLEQALSVWNRGGEGIMVKDVMAPYQRNRNRDWQKVGQPWRDKLRKMP